MSTLKAGEELAASVQKSGHPRVSLADLHAKVKQVQYVNPEFAPHLTVALVECQNGFILIGKSAPADPANFDAEAGKKFAFDDAIRELWSLEGYLLREKLSKHKEGLI